MKRELPSQRSNVDGTQAVNGAQAKARSDFDMWVVIFRGSSYSGLHIYTVETCTDDGR